MDITLIPNYKNWLDQFDNNSDRYYAKKLVEGLTYITTDEFIKAMNTNLDQIIVNLEGNIAFYTVTDRPKDGKEKLLTPYFPENKKDKPNRINPKKGIGSEGDIAHFIRDYCKNKKNCFDHPSLNSLLKNKIRHIFFINDIACSGTQIKDFSKWFFENKTIESWYSYKKIDFYVYTHCISKQGFSTIKKNRFINPQNIFYTKFIGHGSSHWNKYEREQIKLICTKYGDAIDSEYNLGYKESFGTYIYSHKCPNNTPIILWGKTDTWMPLFPSRPNILFQYNLNDIEIYINTLIKNLRLFLSEKIILYSNKTKKSILILKTINKYGFKKEFILKNLELNSFQLDYYIKEMRNFQWLDSNNKITEKGKAILKYLSYKSKKKNIKKKNIEEKEDFYYPMQLRAPD